MGTRTFLLSAIFFIGYSLFLTAATQDTLSGTFTLITDLQDGGDISALPENPVYDDRFGEPGQICSGVNIHFITGHEKDLDMIAAAGFKYVRMDFIWELTEKEKGIYYWSGYDQLASNLSERGLKAIFILDYSNSRYEDTVVFEDTDSRIEYKGIGSPRHPESVAAFTRWAAAAVKHFKNFNFVWEIWNEPNVSFWRPLPDVNEYITLALATAKAVKEAVPDAVLIGPTTSKLPIPFLENFLSSGIIKYLDGVSVHPYRDYSLTPETAEKDYFRLRKLIDKYAPPEKKNIPIISSEWGYASATNGVTVERQAEFLVRMQIANLLNGIPLSIWYDWKNDGTQPGNFEHNCGTVSYELEPKPAYKAANIMNHQLDGFVLTRRIKSENSNDFLVLFRNNSGIFKLCAWTIEKPHTLNLKKIARNENEVNIVDGYGNKKILHTQGRNLEIELENLPQYITLPAGTKIK